MTERDRTRLIPVEDRKRELIAARHTARVTRRYGTSHEPTPDEPAVYPVFLAADEVIGLIAYGRTTALKGPVPGAPRMFERWKRLCRKVGFLLRLPSNRGKTPGRV